MKKSFPCSLGLAVGGMLGLFHATWALLVLLGWAQPFIDWIFQLHMITPPYHIAPFSWMNALILIVVTSVLGYVYGWIAGAIWRMVKPS